MPESIKVDEFIERAASVALVDVRAPKEYAKGHIPGAKNIPLFDDNARALIGTRYHQAGRREAILDGLEIIGPQLKEMADALLALASENQLLLYCWRGGMRSASLAWLADLVGIKVQILDGGYKAFRNFALEIFGRKMNIHVLGGYTGSGKTHILKELESRGEQFIDLEGLAHHKGSAFGGIAQPAQPTQQLFENRLALDLLRVDPGKRVWIEDEGKKVGKNMVPLPLYEQTREADLIFLELPVAYRVERLVKEYGALQEDELATSLEKIRERLGGVNCKEADTALKSGDFAGCAQLLLERYYDGMYLYSVKRRAEDKIHKLAPDLSEGESIVEQILDFSCTLKTESAE